MSWRDVVLERSYNSRAANVSIRKRVSALIACAELCARAMSYNGVQRFSRGSPFGFRETADASTYIRLSTHAVLLGPIAR